MHSIKLKCLLGMTKIRCRIEYVELFLHHMD